MLPMIEGNSILKREREKKINHKSTLSENNILIDDIIKKKKVKMAEHLIKIYIDHLPRGRHFNAKKKRVSKTFNRTNRIRSFLPPLPTI